MGIIRVLAVFKSMRKDKSIKEINERKGAKGLKPGEHLLTSEVREKRNEGDKMRDH